MISTPRREPFDQEPGRTGSHVGFSANCMGRICACMWALVFAAISFYWAAGGTGGSDTIGPAITGMAHDPAFIAVL